MSLETTIHKPVETLVRIHLIFKDFILTNASVPTPDASQVVEIEKLRADLQETQKKLQITEELKKTLENELFLPGHLPYCSCIEWR